MFLADPMSAVEVSAALFPIPTTRTLISLKSDGLFFVRNASGGWYISIPLECLNMKDLPFELLLSFECWSHCLFIQPTTKDDLVKIAGFFVVICGSADLPSGILCIALNPSDGGVELNIPVHVKMCGI